MTHELRTPLAVVRAYTDLLADEPPLDGRRRGTRRGATGARAGTRRPSSRSSGSTGSSTRSSPPSASCPTSRPRSARWTSGRRRRCRRGPGAAPGRPRTSVARGQAPPRPGRPAAAPPDPGAPGRERGEVRPARDRHPARLASWSRASSGSASTDEGPGSRPSGASGSSSRTLGATRTRRAGPASASTRPSASPSRWARRLWCEPAATGRRPLRRGDAGAAAV